MGATEKVLSILKAQGAAASPQQLRRIVAQYKRDVREMGNKRAAHELRSALYNG